MAVHNTTHKHTRILLEYAFIKKYVAFLNTNEYTHDSNYGKFMRNILTYQKADKGNDNPEDDGIDSLSGLCKFIHSFLPHLFN